MSDKLKQEVQVGDTRSFLKMTRPFMCLSNSGLFNLLDSLTGTVQTSLHNLSREETIELRRDLINLKDEIGYRN